MSWTVPLVDVVVSDEDVAAVGDVLRSGWLTMGPRTAAFEEAFAEYAGTGHAVAVSSGTAALHLACVAAGFGPGDEVIVPSMTFVATANAVAYTGARPVFADIAGLRRPWLSVEACSARVTPRTKGIVAVAYGGYAGEVEGLAALCAERGLVLLEDATHAVGSRLGDRHLGTFGMAGAFSLFSNKNLAVGEGGVVITDDPGVAALARSLRSHGMSSTTWERRDRRSAGYDVEALGFNYRLDEPHAELARRRLGRLDADNARRAEHVRAYRDAVAPLDVEAVGAEAAGERPSHHLFAVVCRDAEARARIRRALEDDGVQTSVHYPPVHRLALYRDDDGPPLTEQYADRTLTLPLFAHLSEGQRDHVVRALAAAAA